MDDFKAKVIAILHGGGDGTLKLARLSELVSGSAPKQPASNADPEGQTYQAPRKRRAS